MEHVELVEAPQWAVGHMGIEGRAALERLAKRRSLEQQKGKKWIEKNLGLRRKGLRTDPRGFQLETG